MRFIHRLGYYLGGFALGLIILAFFFSGKKTSCAYFPEARVVKNIKNKPFTLSAKAKSSLATLQLDTTIISALYATADVNFSKSETRREPCGYYIFEGLSPDNKELNMTLYNCDSLVKIEEIIMVN